MNTEATRRLQTSPIFQLSLASKELFHSNFLYWLWKAEPDVFWSVMDSFGIVRDDEIVVKREWENFDLSLVCIGTRKKRGNEEKTEYIADVVAVIENKVKSLPRKEQLDEYDKKIKNVDKDKTCAKILLSLPNPEFDLTDNEWKYVRYEDYVKALNDSRDQATSHYNRAVLTDYCQLLDTLCALKDEWLCGGDSEFLNMKYTSILKSDDDKMMRELRINDIRQKIIYSKISVLLGAKSKLLTDKAITGSAFTNSTGISEVHFIMKNSYDYKEIGLQIQGFQYRRFVIKRRKAISDDDCVEKIMTSFPEQCFGSSFKHNGTKKVGSYGDTFKYLYQTIDDNITIEDLIIQLIIDIKHIIHKFDDIILIPK